MINLRGGGDIKGNRIRLVSRTQKNGLGRDRYEGRYDGRASRVYVKNWGRDRM